MDIIEIIYIHNMTDLVPIVQLSSNMIGPSHIEIWCFGPRALWFHNSMVLKPILGEYSWVSSICLLPLVFKCLSYVCSCCHFIFIIEGPSHLVSLSNYISCCLNIFFRAWQQSWGGGERIHNYVLKPGITWFLKCLCLQYNRCVTCWHLKGVEGLLQYYSKNVSP